MLIWLMLTAQIYEWPHPRIDQDWNDGQMRWREVTSLAYRTLKTAVGLRYETKNAFMQDEPVDILADGDGLYVCCKKESGSYFVRLLPGNDWWKRDYLPLPEVINFHL